MAVKKSLRKNSKAVSPVISTIIIVSVAIVMSIAVAYWMLGLGTSFTRFEKLEFQSAYVVVESNGNFTIQIKIKNTGTAALSLDEVFLNGKPLSAYGGAAVEYLTPSTLEPGDSQEGKISLKANGEWNSGMSVEVTIRTAGGRDYPKTVVLP